MASTEFRKRIRTSIQNEALQAALDANAARRVKGRLDAFASLPDWSQRRQRAHAVRAEVIAHLDEYLDKFIAKVTENGIVVHRAKDAAEAVRVVLHIAKDSPQRTRSTHRSCREARRHAGARRQRSKEEDLVSLSGLRGKKLFAKSKSMVSEEINLNHALEAAGHRVVETDLGEYIVQLRGEKPAHIITPAVHLRRHEVGELFAEKLGIPYTEDIPTLTATARKVLREVFLNADIGISGVNFGVAETGTLCIVTNEGNGRMVTTVPPVHIALMGMERLVPTLDDLALMLSLLPRSATGQKLTVYTQLIHAPRRAQETDGARERHLVIVDNGRARLRSSSLHEALYCIRCGACLNACPVFRELGGHAYVGADGSIAPYSGPIGSVVSPGLLGLEQFGQLAQASSLCGACKDACPVDIDLPKLLTRVRAGSPHPNPSPKGKGARDERGVGLSFASKIGLKAYGIIGSSPKLFAAAQKLAGIGTKIVSPFSEWLWLPSFTGWGYSKDFPRFALKPFHERYKRDPQSAKGLGAKSAESPKKKEETLRELPSFAVQKEKVRRFTEELTALGGKVHCVTQAELTDRLVAFLKERSINAAWMWDQVPDVDETRLSEAGITVIRSGGPTLKTGITGAASAIAETGTLVIPSGKGQPLKSSLLTEIHIAVIESSQILASLEEALQRKEIQSASAVVLVSGPSRTADIEMTLTIGVHGPKELHVFLVDD